ncbi:MAG: TldD/PmbA family protein [Armatimonadota bacterium]|nr:TldD/PmbA family protein [Armatimonadota bacterium]MCX7777368.1 TldD/PmbA family protein [Armatimonadota bacterium]MDW8025364.1 TldD/PmbA family protein [Armatimonadota bacterium]
MEEFAKKVLERCSVDGVSYADVRFVETRFEELVVKNGQPETIKSDCKIGFGVRLIYNGAWGFASSSILSDEEGERVAKLAIEIAKASAYLKRRDVILAPAKPVKAKHRMPFEIDPFEVPLEERLSLLLRVDELMRSVEGIQLSEASMSLWHQRKLFVSTEGAAIEQERIEVGAGMTATAVRGSDVQRRSYPAAHGGNFAAKGYEFILSLNLEEHARRIAMEAVQLLDTEPCPSTVTTVIIGSNQMALQVHESCGHPTELDRVFGTEASFAGTSFLTPDKLGNFEYGSQIVNIVADATIEGSLGSFAYDDEGIPGQRFHLVKEGIFVGYLASRETAPLIGLKGSNGTMRAENYNAIPLIRMTNINLEPGDCTLEEMISDVGEGIFMDTNKSWSIDDKRLNFQFGCEIAWLIRNGRLVKMIKNPTYTGITYEFWRNCDAVGNESEWQLWGLPNCGKGEPMQTMHVGHGVPPARFRNVRVGVVK